MAHRGDAPRGGRGRAARAGLHTCPDVSAICGEPEFEDASVDVQRVELLPDPPLRAVYEDVALAGSAAQPTPR